jgi:hypothetical protein
MKLCPEKKFAQAQYQPIKVITSFNRLDSIAKRTEERCATHLSLSFNRDGFDLLICDSQQQQMSETFQPFKGVIVLSSYP